MNANLTTRKNNQMTINGNVITGDTYPVKDYIKAYLGGKWNAELKGWAVDLTKLTAALSKGNSIGLSIDTTAPAASEEPTGVSGWCNKCHSYCYGDCKA